MEEKKANVASYLQDRPFDPQEAIMKANKGNWLGGRKLTFREKCGAFAALYGGQQNQVVARAFGLSVQTVSKLSGCLENDPDPYRHELEDRRADGTRPDLMKDNKVLMDHNRHRMPGRLRHYDEVAREFEAKGRDRFNALYYTERVHNRIMLAKDELAREKHAKLEAAARAARGLAPLENNPPTPVDKDHE